MIWLHEPEMAQAAALAEVFDTTTPLDENPEAVDAYLAELDTQRANVVATLVEPMTTKLMDLGLTDVLSAELSPVLFVTLDPSHVQTIAHWPEVAEISLLPVLADPEDETDLVLYPETEADALLSAPEALSDPNLNIADDAIWVHIARQRGYTGRGILIGQVEIDGRVDTAHASLRSGISQDTTYTCSSPGTHSTGVAGMMRSNHSTHTGIAVGATLRAAGSCASRYNVGGELFNRTDATIRWGAMSVNHSYGETLYSSSRRKYPTSFDKFYDQKVYFSRRVMVIAGGNECGTYSSRTCLVSSPAMGYNVLTVGAFDDRNTATWYDDRMSSFSSYVDPLSTNGDRNKPEIVAPGTNIYGPYPRGYWKDWSGTSFSAPIVTGVTALMAQANSNLKSYPEAVKAILMATAGHNIEGNSANSTSDGAGAINALWAVEISRGTNGGWGRYSWTCSTSSRTVQTMSLIRGKRTRVALVWAQPPTYGSYSYRPSADLDLRVRDSAGRTVASSSSYDNTYEVVEFTPTTTGNYSIYVANFRCSQAPNYLAWAWWRNP
jgi:subtilisin family serine protease